MKGLTGILPLLSADPSDLFNQELLCSEPDTDQPTPGENKQVSEQEYEPGYLSNHLITLACYFTTRTPNALCIPVRQTFYCSVPTPPPIV